MFFLVFNNPDIKFNTKKLTWRKYIIIEVMPITRWVVLIDKHEFVEATLDEASEMFVVYMTILKLLVLIIIIYPPRKSLLAILE